MEKPVIEGVPFAAALPLPLFSYVQIGIMRLPDGETLEAGIGLTQSMAEQVRTLSLDGNDRELQENTSDRTRFGTGAYADWYAKGRHPFTLVNGEGSLAALIWIGPAALPDGVESANGADAGRWDTIAFRSYAPYRGKGIMTPFGRFVLETYEGLVPDRALWLATAASNEGAIRLYEKLGFVDRGSQEDGTRRILTLETP